MAEEEERLEVERLAQQALKEMSDKAAAAMAKILEEMDRKNPRVKSSGENVVPLRKREIND